MTAHSMPPTGRHAIEGEPVQGTPDTLDVRDLRVAFSSDRGAVQAVDGVSFEVHPREIVAVVGESGSGKSVTAQTVLGLLPETATTFGAVLLTQRGTGRPQDVVSLTGTRLRELRGRDAAMIFQEPSTALNPVYTVGWQMAEGLRAHGITNRHEIRRRSIEMLTKVGIPDPELRIDDFPHQFSGGQKQRVIIAMALLLNPGLIIADEPTTALDVTVQAEILELLRLCRDEFGASVLIITHNMGVVADLSDRVVVMYQGKVVEQTDSRTLFTNPKAAYTRRLLASVPRIREGADRAAHPRPAQTFGEPVVVAQQARVQYPGRFRSAGYVAVPGVDFRISAGEVYGLVGESGSGKTTIARAVAGLTPVTDGSLTVFGHEMRGFREKEFRPVRQRIGFVFQDPASSFNPLLTIAQCVAEPIVIHRTITGAKAIRARVDELLEAVQLPRAYGDRYPHELSGGQRQRASLARALALDPVLLIADEPTSALDVSVQAKVLKLFHGLQQRLRFACLFITHDLAVVDQVADRIGVLHHGILVEEGTNDEVLGAPRDAYTQRLLASLPVPDPVVQEQRRRRLLDLIAADAAV
jgi:peptide/nickel transport system ATP-binding protein